MRIFDRRTLLELFWMAVFLGLVAVLTVVGASLARSETGEALAPDPESLSPLLSPLSPVLLVFHADWCAPCRQMQPTVDALVREGYSVQRINIDRDREQATRFGVAAVPCFIVVERGKEVDRIVGQTSIERLKWKLRRATPAHNPHHNPPERRPHLAWRYEEPVGHRAAVVRVYCQGDARTRSIGSGTLVRWGAEKIVVLTARHVVQDARKIVVELSNRKTHKARVLKVDAVWDCAVLELIGEPEGVAPAELELGEAAMQKEGNRLESCGYGPDGKLACNSGLFLGYRRSTATPDGPDDWFEISGHARQGDSGGGVFNSRGRLVGVLWGTNGEMVVGVQAGRIHLILDEAIGVTVQKSLRIKTVCGGPVVVINRKRCRLLQCRCPTPPKQPPMDITDLPPAKLPGPVFTEESSRKPGKSVLPWRGKSETRDADCDRRIKELLAAQEAERQARLNAQRQPTNGESPKPEKKKDEPSPLLAGLCILAAVIVGFVVYFAAASKNQ
jgi:thiol-disulfide isomerase/thioredoxin